MKENASQELEKGLTALAETLRKRSAPTHHHARAILLPLGQLVLEGSITGLEATVGHLQGLVEPVGEVWLSAVDSELRMACTEHVQSVDPRYLELPNYDLAYTVAARERLEARLRAAELLGIEIAEDLLQRVAAADELLEPHLEGSGGESEETV